MATQIFASGGNDVDGRLRTLAADLRALPPGCVLDCGSILSRGQSVDLHWITSACWPGRDHALALVDLDVLWARGKDVREDPLEGRLDRLQGLLAHPVAGITLCDAFPR